MPESQEHFADQDSPQVGFHPQDGDAKKDENQAKAEGTDILQKGGGSFSQTI